MRVSSNVKEFTRVLQRQIMAAFKNDFIQFILDQFEHKVTLAFIIG